MAAAMTSAVGLAVDIIIEIFGWIGLLGAVVLGVVALIVWAADGTWLPARAIVDRDGPRGGSAASPTAPSADATPPMGPPPVLVRWFDEAGDARSAMLSSADVAAVDGQDFADIWYRHGWQGRARLTKRPPALRPLVVGVSALAALAVISLIVSVVRMFTGG